MSETHYSTCWKDPKHHACAVGEIELCHQRLKNMDQQLKQLEATLKLVRLYALDNSQYQTFETRFEEIVSVCDKALAQLSEGGE